MVKFRLRITGDIGFEFWMDIPEYEGLYQASTYGRVKSIERMCVSPRGIRTVPEKILSPNNVKRYRYVALSKDGKKQVLQVHRLVALAFIPNPNNYPCVNHKSEIRSENFVWNLEWCTYEYNTNYGTANEKRSEKHSKPVLQFDLEGNFIREYTSAKATGYPSYSKICAVCRGERKSAYGYIWKRKKNYG